MRIPFLRAAASLLAAYGATTTEVKAGDYFNSSFGRVYVRYDEGGDLQTYMNRTDQLDKSGEQVWIDGYCGSACTTALGLKKVCVTSRAILGFHKAYNLDSNGRHIPNEEASQLLSSYYPVGVWDALGRHLTEGRRILRAVQLIRAGIPKCPTTANSQPASASMWGQPAASSEGVAVPHRWQHLPYRSHPLPQLHS
jgi:hypothetical protein